MKIKDEECLLWGHSLAEYEQMFALKQSDLNKKILDCAAGFASFNGEMHVLGKQAVSIDAAYNLPLAALEHHVEEGLQNMLLKVGNNSEQFVWQHYADVASLAENNRVTLHRFLKDFPIGKKEHRYIAATLPKLPFKNIEFGLALCAYFLFMEHNQDLDFCIASISEMCRVAKEVRIFPLLDAKGEPSFLIAPVILALQQNNYGIEIKEVPYEFQKGGNAMLRVWSQTCEIK